MNEVEKIEETSVSEQIEKTSINICTFSTLNEATGIPSNFPTILGGESVITDETAKLKVEEAFGQLNIQSVFGFEKYMLSSVVYDTFRVDNSMDKLSPNIYLLKSHQKGVYLLNYLATPYSDLNVDSYFEEVSFMSNALSGVFRRTAAQMNMQLIDDSEQDDICRNQVDKLVGFLHYTIFTERGLRDRENADNRMFTMLLGMFIDFRIAWNEWQCMGTCGQTFSRDDSALQGDPATISCPNCHGTLVKAPPILIPKQIRFTYPSEGLSALNAAFPEYTSPVEHLGYIQGVLMPRNLATTVNRLSADYFSSLAAIPRKVEFQSKSNPEEKIQLTSNYRIDGDRLSAFISFSDTTFSVDEYADTFVPTMSAITLERDMVEGFQKGYSFEKIIGSSIIADWILTETIDISELEKFPSIGDFATVRGDEN